MRRFLFIATLALLVPTAWAQMRGGGMRAMPAGRMGFAPRAGGGIARPAMPVRGGVRWGTRFGTPFFPGSPFFFHHHHHFFDNDFDDFFFNNGFLFNNRFFNNGFFPWGWGYGYSYPVGYPMYDTSYAYPPPNYAPAYEEDRGRLAYEVERLNDAIDRLLEQERHYQAAATPPPAAPAPAPAKTEAGPSTALVFRDGHTEDVRNYAIVGQTLWLFTEQRARKVPLSDLNLPATTQRNEERGIEFTVPPPKKGK